MKAFLRYIKFYVMGICLILFMGCMTQSEKFTRMSYEEIRLWSDEALCSNAYRSNPSIKSELLRRKLLTEKEFEYLFLSNEHQHFPKKGMPKCAMWTFTNGGELVTKLIMPDGTIREVWKVHRGEYIIFKSFGGRYYLITIDNDRITNVSAPLQ